MVLRMRGYKISIVLLVLQLCVFERVTHSFPNNCQNSSQHDEGNGGSLLEEYLFKMNFDTQVEKRLLVAYFRRKDADLYISYPNIELGKRLKTAFEKIEALEKRNLESEWGCESTSTPSESNNMPGGNENSFLEKKKVKLAIDNIAETSSRMEGDDKLSKNSKRADSRKISHDSKETAPGVENNASTSSKCKNKRELTFAKSKLISSEQKGSEMVISSRKIDNHKSKDEIDDAMSSNDKQIDDKVNSKNKIDEKVRNLVENISVPKEKVKIKTENITVSNEKFKNKVENNITASNEKANNKKENIIAQNEKFKNQNSSVGNEKKDEDVIKSSEKINNKGEPVKKPRKKAKSKEESDRNFASSNDKIAKLSSESSKLSSANNSQPKDEERSNEGLTKQAPAWMNLTPVHPGMSEDAGFIEKVYSIASDYERYVAIGKTLKMKKERKRKWNVCKEKMGRTFADELCPEIREFYGWSPRSKSKTVCVKAEINGNKEKTDVALCRLEMLRKESDFDPYVICPITGRILSAGMNYSTFPKVKPRSVTIAIADGPGEFDYYIGRLESEDELMRGNPDLDKVYRVTLVNVISYLDKIVNEKLLNDLVIAMGTLFKRFANSLYCYISATGSDLKSALQVMLEISMIEYRQYWITSGEDVEKRVEQIRAQLRRAFDRKVFRKIMEMTETHEVLDKSANEDRTS